MHVVRAAMLLAVLHIVSFHGGIAKAQGPTDAFESFGQFVFIGQAYPSGNVYLRRFSDTASWPDSVSLLEIGSPSSLPETRRAAFGQILTSRSGNSGVQSFYIPGVEGIDEDHKPCGLGNAAQRNLAHQQLSADFFHTVFDHCDPNDGVAMYRAEPSNHSVMVIGIAGSMSFANPKVILDKPPRALTTSERLDVEKQKVEAAKSAGREECSTTPAYLDAAVQIFEASVPERNVTLRVSTYQNPGCAGHLRAIYVLDVFRGGQVLKTFELNQDQGVI